MFYALFVLAGIGFSPFGYTRTEVFVSPKVQLWLVSLMPLLGLLLLDVRRRSAEAVVHDRGRAKAVPAAVVAAFVAIVVLIGITALHGNREAWFGYPSIPEGALFFVALLAGFGLLWALTRRYAGLERGVRVAVVVVASIASLASVPQVIDWRTDFTMTSGQTIGEPPRHTLVGVWRDQSPNTFYWHRGHFGIVACLGLLVAAGSMLRRASPSARLTALSDAAIVVTAFGVMVSSTRAPQLAAGVGLVLLWGGVIWLARGGDATIPGKPRQVLARCGRQALSVMLGFVLAAALLVSAGDTRAASLFGFAAGQVSAEAVFTGTSGRAEPWALTIDAWSGSPWIGRGFLAFHGVQAEPIVRRAVDDGALTLEEARRVHVTEATVHVIRDDGALWWRFLWGTKPHNVLLELLLSVGLVGTVAVLSVYGLALMQFVRRREVLGLAIVVAWFTYLVFWYESVQYSALVWALLAVLLARAQPAVEQT